MMNESLDQKVRYTVDLINARGDIWGQSEERIGRFIGFSDNYEFVVIEEQCGSIVHVDYRKVRFIR
jgi:hypothetical protein